MVYSQFGKYFICCKDCTDRKTLCHSYCEKYLNAKKQVELLKRKIASEATIYTKRQENYIRSRTKSR